MGSFRQNLADTFASNHKINKKALQIKSSWDEVAKLINANKSGKKQK